MNATMLYLVSFFGGIVYGLLFFGGLWFTLKGLEHERHPVVRMLGSMLLRFAFVLGGFYLLTQFAEWQHLLIAAAGFTLPRLFMARRQARRIDQESLT